MSIFANPDEVFLSQYVLPGSSEWPAEEREAALKSIDRAVKHTIQQIEHDRAHGTERAEAIYCDHSRWREVEAEVEKLRKIIDELVWDGCVDDDGECWWCGGALEPVSCNRENHVGCMGYSDKGDHAEDCPYVAAREASAWRTG